MSSFNLVSFDFFRYFRPLEGAGRDVLVNRHYGTQTDKYTFKALESSFTEGFWLMDPDGKKRDGTKLLQITVVRFRFQPR